MASKQGASSGEKIIDVKRVVREEKPVQRINFYAALGIAILTMIILTGLIVLLMLTSGSLDYQYQQPVGMSGFIAGMAIFLALPVLLASKYGWRTIVATVLTQSLLTFFLLLLLSLIASTGGETTPYSYGDDVIDYGLGVRN